MTSTEQFKECGTNVNIHDNVVVRDPEKIILKNNILLSSFVCIEAGQGVYIGNHVDLSFYSTITGGGYCIVDDFVSISAGCRLLTGMDDVEAGCLLNDTIPMSYRSYKRSYVRLEKHVFLATNVVVYPGVTIGEGSVVGSGSVVMSSLPPWGVYLGAPARKVRTRPQGNIPKIADMFYRTGNISQNLDAVLGEFIVDTYVDG